MIDKYWQLLIHIFCNGTTGFVLFEYMNKAYIRKLSSRVIYVASYVLYVTGYTLVNQLYSPFANASYGFFGFILVSYLLYDKYQNKLALDILFMFYLMMVDTVVMAFCSFFLSVGMNEIIENMQALFLLGVITQFVILCTYRPFMRLILKTNITSVTWQLDVFLLPLTIFECITLFSSVYLIHNSYAYYFLLLLIVGFLGTDIYIIYIFEKVSFHNELKRRYNLQQQQQTLLNEHYQEMEAKYEQSRKILHDMKSHIQALEQLYHLADSEQGLNYARQLYEQIDHLGCSFKCGNKILTVLINNAFQTASRENIRFSVQMQEINLDFIPDIDITTLFSNLIRNAFEACAEIKDQPKIIELRIHRFHHNIVINLSNSYIKPDLSSGRRRSTKAGHAGIGLTNVQNVIERYEGMFKVALKHDRFETHIVLPDLGEEG